MISMLAGFSIAHELISCPRRLAERDSVSTEFIGPSGRFISQSCCA